MIPQDSSHLPQAPAERHAPIPGWLTGIGLILAFWAGGYLFLYSGGFRGDVYDPGQITWGPVSTGPVAPPDPKVIGKRLYAANCAQCHQANGLGQAGVYPPLAGADWVTGSKHRLISILHHGLAGPVTVKGNLYNNNMPAWGDGAPVPLKDEQSSRPGDHRGSCAHSKPNQKPEAALVGKRTSRASVRHAPCFCCCRRGKVDRR
jgi:mono/diheme cytochrome c family protein